MIDSQVIAFTLAAGALTLVPGADTMLVIRNVIRGGRKDGVVTTFGICSGLFVHATLSALGVSVILMHSASLFHAVRLAGACYLCWLGLRSIWAAVRSQKETEAAEAAVKSRQISMKQCFIEGFLSNVLNPKAVVFYLAFLPQFIGPKDPVFEKSILLAGIHFTEGILWLVTLSFLLDHTRQFIVHPRFRRCLEGCCGALLIGIGIRLTTERG